MDISSDKDNCTPPELIHLAQTATENRLPAQSKRIYESAYKSFMEWRCRKKANSFSENVILAYFGELSDKYKASSLWTHYSMLRSTLEIHHNIKLNTYGKLRALLKRKSDRYQAKKAKTFTNEQINMFIEIADDQKYLATKVALIMGIMGACRCTELREMNIENLQDLTSALLVNIPNTKTKVVRNFIITGNFYEIVKKYISLRPPKCSTFFLNYQNGKCTRQNIGINKFSMMGKQIAIFLNLPNPELYTGTSFRRSSETLLVDAGDYITTLKTMQVNTVATELIEGNRVTCSANGLSTNDTTESSLDPLDLKIELEDTAILTTYPQVDAYEENLNIKEVDVATIFQNNVPKLSGQVADPLSVNVTELTDDFGQFGKYVTGQLGKLPTINALRCQAKIRTILNNESITVLNMGKSKGCLL